MSYESGDDHMTGKEVTNKPVIAMVNASENFGGRRPDSGDIACVIPHQANLRIIEAIADR